MGASLLAVAKSIYYVQLFVCKVVCLDLLLFAWKAYVESLLHPNFLGKRWSDVEFCLSICSTE